MKSKGIKGLIAVIAICTMMIGTTAFAKSGWYGGYYSITYDLTLKAHSGTATTSGAVDGNKNYASVVVYNSKGNSLGCICSTSKAKATAKKTTGLKTVKKGKSCHAVCDSKGNQLESFTKQLTLTKTR